MKTIHPQEIVNESPLKKFHFLLIGCLFFIMMFDGYDVVIYGATIPFLKADWAMTDLTAGAISSYTTIGTAIGAVLFGLYADRFGKRRMILFTTFLLSCFTFLSGFAPTATLFIICRVIAGLGFGGVMPNIAALISEYAPIKYRAAIISFIFCGYSVGAIAASFSGRYFLETFGWHPVYWLGGLPLLCLPIIWRLLPESLHTLMKKQDTAALKIVLQKITPLERDIQFTYTATTTAKKSSVRALFTAPFAVSTLMFWLSCFCAFILMYSLNTWLPTLMMHTGYTLNSSLVFVAVLQLGAIAGTIAFSNVIERFGFKRILIPLYIVGAVALLLIGYVQNIYIAYALIAVIGAASVGLQNMSNAYVAAYYPTDVRAAALGSTMAFGRIGSIVAPTYVGMLLTLQLQPQFNFMAIGIAAILGAIALSFVREKHAHYTEKAPQHTAEQLVKL